MSMFGPLNISRKSVGYGTVLNTPKLAWKNFNIAQALSEKLNITKSQILIETDVNCAASLEYIAGNHHVDSLAYITIGTGVGAGIIINGSLVHGLLHPEGGHIRILKHFEDHFKGNCPYHADCLEGLVTNGAIKERKGLHSVDDVANIPEEDELWDLIAYYIAQGCLNILYIISIEKIIIGGGIINNKTLLGKIQKHFISLNNKYIDHPLLEESNIHNYIVRTGFKNFSGILSAFTLEK